MNIVYYTLLGVSKIRKFVKNFLPPPPSNTIIIDHDGDITHYNHDTPYINKNHRLICISKNGVKHISCAQRYTDRTDRTDKTDSDSEELILKPNKYIEIIVLPDQIDIADKFSKYIPHDNCCNKVSWEDILKFEGIEITYLTKIDIINHDMESKKIENLLECPY